MAQFRCRGREIGEEDILSIRALIERYPKESRRRLSTRICEAWQWRQANGALRDMVCRGLLLMLERAGQITLPPVSYVRHNPLAHRARPEPVLIDKTPIEGRLRTLQPLEFEQVRRTAQEPLFNSLMEEHHYLGYEQPVGEHLKFLVWAAGRPIACLIKPARDELIRQAAQGTVVHNDDTGMRVLMLNRDPSDERTGVFTSGIVSVGEGHKIALYFTGSRHAGENLAEVLKKRRAELPSPIQMCDALSRNVPKLPAGVEILLANCLAHGRRQFVDVAENFPNECRHVLEMLGQVYLHDAEARERGLTPEERLRLHQERSRPVMDKLHAWLEAQLTERRTEPNSGLGQAIGYLLRHWKPLTLFLRQAGAPLDNNLVERSLKRAVLHRKNALFYRTLNGAQVGDLFMSLIHTCQLCGANSFDYLIELQRHAQELAACPAQWMPWNYRETLARIVVPDSAEL